jgi:hypothetical protein
MEADFTDDDKVQIREAIPPELLKMSLAQLRQFLLTKRVDSADTSLYPQIEKWAMHAKERKPKSASHVQTKMEETARSVQRMLRGIPSLSGKFTSDPLFANLMVWATTKAIHDKCYDADYSFDFGTNVQPFAIYQDQEPPSDYLDVVVDRRAWGAKPILDWQFVCKLTSTTCATFNENIREVQGYEFLKPFLYKRFAKKYISEHETGPGEGCYVFGPLKNFCDMAGFEFDAVNGRCKFTEESCAKKAGMNYDAKTDRCWMDNVDYFYGLLFSDSALLGSKSAEYKIVSECAKGGVPQKFCLLFGARGIGYGAGLGYQATMGAAGAVQGVVDPRAAQKGIKEMWESFGDDAKREFMDTSDPLSMGKLKVAGSLLGNTITTVTGGIGIGLGEVIKGFGGDLSGSQGEQAVNAVKEFGKIFMFEKPDW